MSNELLGRSNTFSRITPLRHEDGYAWISSDDLLIVTPDIPDSCPYPFETGHQQRIACLASRLKISTGMESPFDEFNRRHSNDLVAGMMQMHYLGCEDTWDKEIAFHPPDAVLSPDGRYLCWSVSTRRSLRWRVASLDGQETAESRGAIEPHHFLWLRDNRHFLTAINRYRRDSYFIPELRLYRRDDPSYVRRIAVTGLGDGLLAGLTERNTFLIDDLDLGSYRGTAKETAPFVKFSEVGLDRSTATANHREIAKPVSGKILDIVLDPDGNQLAWLIEEEFADDIYSLWVTNLRGGGVRKIGELYGPPVASQNSPSGYRVPIPRGLRWSPDGSRISFTFDYSLWQYRL